MYKSGKQKNEVSLYMYMSVLLSYLYLIISYFLKKILNLEKLIIFITGIFMCIIMGLIYIYIHVLFNHVK